MLFTLMNKNKRILKFEYNFEYNAYLGVKKVIDVEYAPLPLKNCDIDIISNVMYKWLSERRMPPLRDNLKYLLDYLKQDNSNELMMHNYGLSLSDQYWFLPENEDIKWQDINFFDNSYDSSDFMKATFGDNVLNDLNIDTSFNTFTSPNMSTNGQLSKCWVRFNDQNYLFKGANTRNRFETICENVATYLCSILNVPHVNYKIGILSGSKSTTLVSVCKPMIDSHQEFIPANHILSQKAELVTNSVDDYYLYLDILNEQNVPNAKEYLQKMIILDYIMANEDRHLGNFGIIRDVESLQWVSICPIFDTGRSLNTNITNKFWLDQTVEMKFFTNKFVSSEMVEQFIDYPINEQTLKKLYDAPKYFDELLHRFIDEIPINKEDIVMLVQAFNQRIELLEKASKQRSLLIK